MNRLRPPDLAIMDAVLDMEGFGPASLETRWVNKIFASNDPVALDVVQAEIIWFGVDDVPYLKLARELGMGETDLAQINVVGDYQTIKEYHKPATPESSYSYRAGVGDGKTSIDYYRQRVAYRSFISREKCPPGPSACADNCPSGALFLESGIPALNAESCLGCSVCKESCNHGALVLKPHEAVVKALLKREENELFPLK